VGVTYSDGHDRWISVTGTASIITEHETIAQYWRPGLEIWFLIAGIGALIILVGILAFVIQIAVSIMNRDKLRDTTGDPWDGRTLEWSTSSPPPPYNFAFTPVVHDIDAWYDMKMRGHQRPAGGYRSIHMPKNTGAGAILSAISVVFGFAMIWHIWWLAILSFVAMIGGAIYHSFNFDRDRDIPANQVAEVEARAHALAAQGAN